MTAIILTAPEAKTAPQTIRVFVKLVNGDRQRALLDLVIPLDSTPCRPKIQSYVSAEFPGYAIASWWTVGEEF